MEEVKYPILCSKDKVPLEKVENSDGDLILYCPNCWIKYYLKEPKKTEICQKD